MTGQDGLRDEIDAEAQNWRDMAADWRIRYDAAVARAEAAERQLYELCVCGKSPTTYDGPQRDCPIHGEPDKMWTELEARAEAAEQAVQRVRALHGRNVYGELDFCVICVHTEGADYPCDTIRALDGKGDSDGQP